MNHSLRSSAIALVLGFVAAACQPKEGDLEQHAAACESLCGDAQSECAAEPAFADPWALSCEVSCNLDFNDDAHPFEACMDAASTCEAKDACLGAGPSAFGSDDGASSLTNPVGDDSGPPAGDESGDTPTDHDTTTGDDPTADDSSGGAFEGPPCCDTSGAGACDDAEVLECTCGHMPACCTGAWTEACVSVAVANDCISDGCASLDGWTNFSCTCNTYDVYCPDNPFASQIIFGTDACGLSEAEALATANAACEQGDGDCEIGAGSCECNCTDYGDACGAQR